MLHPAGEDQTDEPVTRPSFDEYFLGVSEAVSVRSSCVRRKVGAVVVNNRRIVASGYNDSPAGMPGCEACPRRTSSVPPGSSYDTGPGACVAIHAEANALLHCNREDLVGSTLYLTDKPCDGCMKLIIGAGVARVVWEGASIGISRTVPDPR